MEDFDVVMNLWSVCQLPYKPKGRERRDKIEKEIGKDTARFLVAELDGQVIGTVLATHDGRKGWINRLAVAPGFRCRGIGRLLLEKAESALHDLGIEIIACLIEDYNQSSMEFFREADYCEHRDIIYFTKRRYPDI
jgi:ribosomal protein S18 acetylase RimI-like enzyme